MQFELKNVQKIYRTGDDNITFGAKNISLQIKEGDFLAVVGPSGSGKTTLLNLIAGLIRPDQGQISHGDIDLTPLSLEERTLHRLHHMGFIFQDYQLLPILTAFENAEFPLQIKKLNQKEINSQVNWALEQVGLGNLKKRYPRQLSGGQQQRVSIARAIAGKPKLILADEPTANLDSKTSQEIIELFKFLNKEFNLTFLFSTHDQRLIDQVKSIIYIEDGEIVKRIDHEK